MASIYTNIGLKLKLIKFEDNSLIILSPIIKREYKHLLTGVFRKMENDAKGNLEVI